MGAFKTGLEFAGPAYKEWLSRYEADWKYENIAPQRSRIYDIDMALSTRRSLVSDLLRPMNGRVLDPYSEAETFALTVGLNARFKAWAAYKDALSSYDLDPVDEDFRWQQQTIDGAERILQGYVNLVTAVNLDGSLIDGESHDRIEEFLLDNEKAIVDAFSSQGGPDAFAQKTLGMQPDSPIMWRIFDQLNAIEIDAPSAGLSI